MFKEPTEKRWFLGFVSSCLVSVSERLPSLVLKLANYLLEICDQPVRATVNVTDGRDILRADAGDSLQGKYDSLYKRPYVGSMSFGLTRSIDGISCNSWT